MPEQAMVSRGLFEAVTAAFSPRLGGLGSKNAGSEATLEDPFLWRLRFRRTTTIKPVHMQAPRNIRLTI